jgi:hypothetical protein
MHCPPDDMLRLHAALLPRDVLLRGVEISRDGSKCQRYQPKLHRPQTKKHLAMHFNEVVQHDLFFLWDETHMRLIDEAVRRQTGDLIPNGLGSTIVKALLSMWIRLWGPMANSLSDQEGGLLSTIWLSTTSGWTRRIDDKVTR